VNSKLFINSKKCTFPGYVKCLY